MTVDLENTVAVALVTLLDTHPDIVAVTGQASGNISPERDVAVVPKPMLLYELETLDEIGGAGLNHQMDLRITAIAEGPTARRDTGLLVAAVRAIVTQPALYAQGLDSCPIGSWRRTRIPLDPDASRALAGATMHLTLLIHQ